MTKIVQNTIDQGRSALIASEVAGGILAVLLVVILI